MLYKNINDQAQARVEQEGQRIEKKLTAIFHETYKVMLTIGQTVINSNPDELLTAWEDVTETFGKESHLNHSFVWPNFGWIPTHNEKVFQIEAVPPFSDRTTRKFLQNGEENPWNLQFIIDDQANITSNEPRLLSMNLGITDNEYSYLGALTAHFQTSDLIKSIDTIIKDYSVAFAILDTEGHIILQSLGKKISENKNLWSELQQLSTGNLLSKNTIAFYNKIEIPETPFTLLTFIDTATINNIYYQIFFPRFMKFVVGGVCFLILVYLFLSSSIKEYRMLAEAKQRLEDAILLAEASDNAKEEFLARVRSELMEPFVNIVTYAEILIKYLKREMDLELSTEKQLQFLDRIHQSCNDLKTLTTNVLDISSKNIKPILEECLKILAKEALMKSVNLTGDIPTLPTLLIDELRFKQIIVGLLSKSIQLSPQGNVSLSACLTTREAQKFLKIVIQDDGIGLGEEEWLQMASLYKNTAKANGLHLELSAIKRLVHMLHGEYDIKNVWKQGNTVTLLFPYYTQKQWEERSQKTELEKSSVFLCDWEYVS